MVVMDEAAVAGTALLNIGFLSGGSMLDETGCEGLATNAFRSPTDLDSNCWWLAGGAASSRLRFGLADDDMIE